MNSSPRLHSSMTAFIFDIDGTIIDSMRFHERSWDVFLTRRGVPTVGEDFFRQHGRTHGRRGDARAVRSAVGRRRACVRAREGGHLPRALRAGVPRDRRASRRSRGTRRRPACASRARRPATPTTSRSPSAGSRWTDFFDAAVGAHDVARGKPEPDLFLLAAQAHRRALRRSAWSSRTRRSESKRRAAPGCAPWPSRRRSLPTNWARPRTSSRERRISRRWTRGRSRRIFSPDPTHGSEAPTHGPTPARHPRRRSTRTRSSPSAARSSRRCARGGNAFPNDFRRDALAARPARAIRRENERGARAARHRGRGRRPDAAEAR